MISSKVKQQSRQTFTEITALLEGWVFLIPIYSDIHLYCNYYSQVAAVPAVVA